MVVDRKVVALLNEDPERNANILGFIANNEIERAEIFGSSVLVVGVSDRRWVYISSQSEADLIDIKKALTPEDKCFAVIEDWIIPVLTGGSAVKWELTTMKFVLPREAEIASLGKNVEAAPLSPSHAQYIYDNYTYQQYTDVPYITERLARGPSAGVFDGEKLVAWALTHDDGAIGFLQVLEEYRGKGYALAVTRAVIDAVRAEGHIPFVHIEETNENSLGLCGKMGFVQDRRVRWFELE